MTDPAATSTQFSRIFYAVEYMANLEGQDKALVVEMSQDMLNDVIEGRGLKPLAEYIRRYCDVIDSEADAERIASEI
ncbi:MAG TPA: hypothetical protein VFD73_19340 [Gemmatimonadales bacterium]|nr:hypothetical protein [Gemmatimonadales bacterium]